MQTVPMIFLVLALAGCAAQPKSAPYSWEVVNRLSDEQWEREHLTDAYVTFNTEWLLFNNANYVDQKGNCYALSAEVEDLILIQNEVGVIHAVVPQRRNAKTACFVKAFLGKKYPAPPYAPFYHYMRMQKE